MKILVPALLLCAATAQAIELPQGPLDADGCVDLALRNSPKLAEAEAKLTHYRGVLAEVQSVYGPKLQALGFVAPMFTVEGSALDKTVKRKYGPTDWGPYAHLEAALVLPFYTFGRVEAGEDAAKARLEVERARVREAENVLALEVRKLYSARLFALSMIPSLKLGQRLVDEAFEKASALNAAGTGEVTQVDLMKLRYGQAETRRYLRIAKDGAALAHAALKHTMGLPHDTALELADKKLQKSAKVSRVEGLPALLHQAAAQRPEWIMTRQGKRAALSFRDAQRLANAPALFIGGQLGADWAPTRDDASNPYHFDQYNQVLGGVAVGFFWDFDYQKTRAKVQQADALIEEVEALTRFARTGIPLQVFMAHQAVTQHRALVAQTRASVKATRKWMTFAATAYSTGTGEARDVLEGLVAYLGAKRAYYQHLRAFHDARADLLFAVGHARRPQSKFGSKSRSKSGSNSDSIR